MTASLLFASFVATPAGGEEQGYVHPVLLPNASFEVLTDVGGPASWEITPSGAAEVTEEHAFDGQRAIKVIDPASTSVRVRSARVPATPGLVYQASAQARTLSGTSASMYLEFFAATGGRISEVHLAPPNSGNWESVELQAVAPPGTTHLDILLYGGGSSVGVTLYDAVKVQYISSEKPYDPKVGTDPQLFVDHHRIASMSHAALKVHPAVKERIVLRADQPWETNNVYLYGSIIRDPASGLLRMWYTSYNAAVKDYLLLLATSKDGKVWTKPNLGLFEYEGSKENNIVGIYESATVILDEQTQNSAERYKMMSSRKDGYRVWFSPDGLTWTPAVEGPVLPNLDVASVMYDPVNEQFVASIKIVDRSTSVPDRQVFQSTSKDFKVWSEPRLVLKGDDRDHGTATAMGLADAQIYTFPITHESGVYVGLPTLYYLNSAGRDGPIDVQFAFSRDLRNWTREDRTPAITRGVTGGFDSGMIFTASNFVRLKDRVVLYYGGWSGWHGAALGTGRTANIGMATWRHDGFSSISNGGELTATILTKPVIFEGEHLRLNANVTGSLKVELLDTLGNVIPGYSADLAKPIKGDKLNHRVSWKGSKGLKELAGTEVVLRFTLQGGDIYSFQFTAD